MTLRRLALLALPIAALATACGDPDSVGTTPDTTIAGIEHPMGADEPILRLTVAGGFVPVESAFANVPQITIYGDGTVITPGVMTMIYPGPMVAPLNQRTISEEGIQRVLDAADAAGLLAPAPSYESPGAQQVADAPTTELVINAGGGQWTHSAYALDMAADTAAREQLLAFVTSLSDLGALAGADTLGPEEPYVADQYRIRAVANPEHTSDLQPTVVPWPDPAVNLAEATECAIVSGPTVTEALLAANQLTWFTQDGVTYSLMVRPLLPGDPAC
jgi:hypothetical protein